MTSCAELASSRTATCHTVVSVSWSLSHIFCYICKHERALTPFCLVSTDCLEKLAYILVFYNMAQKPKFGPKKYLTDEDLMEILRSDSADEHFMENLEDECDHSETSSENSETDQEAGEELQEQEGNEEDEQIVQDEEIAEQELQAAREPKGKRKTATPVG
jgi:hypothetical protein